MPLTQKQDKAIRGWREALGRWQAAQMGLTIDGGAWLHSSVNRKPVAHGYLNLYRKFHRVIWTNLNKETK